MSVFDRILKLVRQLYPTGRAWHIPFESFFEALHRALAYGDSEVYSDAMSTMDALLPDNPRFTANDATFWEKIYGLTTDPLTSLDDRKLAIAQRMSEPGLGDGMSHFQAIEAALQAAGFNVYVYENIFPLYPSGYETKNPAVIAPALLSPSQHGDPMQHGVQSHYINHVVVNSIDNDIDVNFSVGPSLRATFFIGGAPLGTFANIPASRRIEFRQLILRLKPVPNVAYLLINHI
jgi:hypothetical protein